MNEIIPEGCNKAQREAICHGEGPALVIAGPGSGKTFVVTHRILYLIKHLGISPENILVITFTKAAAAEMQERTKRLLETTSSNAGSVAFGTFHSVFFHILMATGRYNSGSILKERDKYLLLKSLVEECDIDTLELNELIRDIINDISRYKIGYAAGEVSQGAACDSAKGACQKQIAENEFVPRAVSAENFEKIYSGYCEYLHNNRRLDFDDMLIEAYRLLRDNAPLRNKWQDRFRYIMIDEFQDIDELQFKTIKLLLPEKRKNLFVVGDDDQSIYSFRGARPDIMLGFEKSFEYVRKILLNTNYRSAKRIVRAAGLVIEGNCERFKKEIVAAKTCEGKLMQVGFPDIAEEDKYVAEYIKTCQRECETGKSIAILTRTNKGAEHIAEYLQAKGIAFTMKEKRSNIYSHFIAGDILAYIQLAMGSRQRRDMYRIMNRPLRYISRAAVEQSGDTPDLEGIYRFYVRKGYGADAVKRLIQDLKLLGRMKPYGAIHYILRAVGYDAFLKEYAAENRLDYKRLLEVAKELLERSRMYNSLGEYLEGVANYTEQMDNEVAIEKNSAAMVTISTLHSSKGLEYDTVFIIDAVEGNIPYSRAGKVDNPEEERRLFYVGMTRARQELYILYTGGDKNSEKTKSRFLTIDTENML